MHLLARNTQLWRIHTKPPCIPPHITSLPRVCRCVCVIPLDSLSPVLLPLLLLPVLLVSQVWQVRPLVATLPLTRTGGRTGRCSLQTFSAASFQAVC